MLMQKVNELKENKVISSPLIMGESFHSFVYDNNKKDSIHRANSSNRHMPGKSNATDSSEMLQSRREDIHQFMADQMANNTHHFEEQSPIME